MVKIRHIFLAAVVLCLFLTDCSGRVLGGVDTVRSRQAQIDTFLVHFWDGVDLSDSTLYAVPAESAAEEGFSAMEEKAAAFFSVLPSGSDSVVFRAVKALMDKAVAVSSSMDAYGFFMSAENVFITESRVLLLRKTNSAVKAVRVFQTVPAAYREPFVLCVKPDMPVFFELHIVIDKPSGVAVVRARVGNKQCSSGL